jgi:hypothetical protein
MKESKLYYNNLKNFIILEELIKNSFNNKVNIINCNFEDKTFLARCQVDNGTKTFLMTFLATQPLKPMDKNLKILWYNHTIKKIYCIEIQKTIFLKEESKKTNFFDEDFFLPFVETLNIKIIKLKKIKKEQTLIQNSELINKTKIEISLFVDTTKLVDRMGLLFPKTKIERDKIILYTIIHLKLDNKKIEYDNLEWLSNQIVAYRRHTETNYGEVCKITNKVSKNKKPYLRSLLHRISHSLLIE